LRDALAHGALRIKTRETLALALAEYHGCDYCLSAHVASSAKAGMGDADVSAARSGSSSDPRIDAAVKFALAVTKGRGSVSDDELAAVRAAGYDDGEILEIIANVALNVFTNYVNKVAQTEIDFPPVRSGEAA
jgi:AhpD family alkylhydroperoxidase